MFDTFMSAALEKSIKEIDDNKFLDQCAIKAMPSLIELSSKDYKDMAVIAYEMADAMLAERNKRRGINNE